MTVICCNGGQQVTLQGDAMLSVLLGELWQDPHTLILVHVQLRPWQIWLANNEYHEWYSTPYDLRLTCHIFKRTLAKQGGAISSYPMSL